VLSRTTSMAAEGSALTGISLEEQARGFSCLLDARTEVERGVLTCTLSLRPKADMGRYVVLIRYELGFEPRVWVVEPKLRSRPDKVIPHTYPGERLCLWWPGARSERKWSPNALIRETIVPWTSLWLYYYEHWLVTGTWGGGGVDH